MQLREVMNTPAVTCSLASTLEQAAMLMWEHDCGSVPVLDDQGHLVGIITDRDIAMAAYIQGRPLAQIVVTAAMAKTVVAAHDEDPVERAEHLMADNQIRRVPVLDHDEHVVGVVSLNDLARLAARTRKSGFDRELVQTMASVCRPRAPHNGDAHPDVRLPA